MRASSGVAHPVVILLACISLKDAYDLSVRHVVAVCKSSTDLIMGRASFFHCADDCLLCCCCVRRHELEDIESLWFIQCVRMMSFNAC